MNGALKVAAPLVGKARVGFQRVRAGRGGAVCDVRRATCDLRPAACYSGRTPAAMGSMVCVVPRDMEQVVHLFAMVNAVALVPAADEPHHPRHDQAKGDDGAKH